MKASLEHIRWSLAYSYAVQYAEGSTKELAEAFLTGVKVPGRGKQLKAELIDNFVSQIYDDGPWTWFGDHRRSIVFATADLAYEDMLYHMDVVDHALGTYWKGGD